MIMVIKNGDGSVPHDPNSNSDEPYDEVWLVRSNEGEPAGARDFEEPHSDNPRWG